MKLYLMRHGEAGQAAMDVERRLTLIGIEQCQAKAEFLKNREIDLVFASPYVRTQETIAEVRRHASNLAAPELNDYLTPDNDPFESFAEFEKIVQERKVNSILLVTHLPLIAYLASVAIDGGINNDYVVSPSTLIVMEAESFAEGCFQLKQMV